MAAPALSPSFRNRSAGFLANHMARLFAQALAEALQPLGLAPAQFMTLVELWREDGLTQRDLVRRLDVEQATMASTLNRMSRDGLIKRRPHPNDNRAQLITLTPRAKALEGPAIEAARAVNARALGSLSEDEQQRVIDSATRIIEGLRTVR